MHNPFDASRVAQLISDSAQAKQLLAQQCSHEIFSCGEILVEAVRASRLIMLCGNGGSAADCQHIAAELVIRFRSSVERRAIAAIALTTDTSMLTAGGNDYGFDHVFSRQVEAYGKPKDVLIAITTSGNSANVINASQAAKAHGITVIGLLGGSGGAIKDLCDASVVVPSSTTARIQESHILIGHIWCEQIEDRIFGVSPM
ncbi:MAG: SIS domain-containing protein [Ignavibacteria bacterium]|nr:SIS domain-containing protein [Ignavibacteria bacterium]